MAKKQSLKKVIKLIEGDMKDRLRNAEIFKTNAMHHLRSDNEEQARSDLHNARMEIVQYRRLQEELKFVLEVERNNE